MSDKRFEIIILIGRPASGKSEVIDYVKNGKLPDTIEDQAMWKKTGEEYPWVVTGPIFKWKE